MRSVLSVMALCALLAPAPVPAAQECAPGVAPTVPTARFTIHGDGTVTDRRHGLTWKRCAEGQRWDGETCLEGRAWYMMSSWTDAVAGLAKRPVTFAGHDDWRLPSLEELRTLVDRTCVDPATNTELFPNTPSWYFWTATESSWNDAYAWRIDFATGRENADLKLTSSYDLRLVRGTFRSPAAEAPLEFVEIAPDGVRDDGIHDPALASLDLLQRPEEALAGLPRSITGGVDWVGALRSGAIEPRAWRDGEGPPLRELDFTIVLAETREMPYVRFPHKAHTEWLDCSNCHPAIFAPRVGANDIAMNGILRGRQCGVCHGTVAFSVYECERCHNVMHEDAPERWW